MRITKDGGEGDGPDGTHFVVAVDGEEPQLPIVEFNLSFHIACHYTAAGKGKLLTTTLTDNSQIFLGEHPWVETNLSPISLHKHMSRALHRCAGQSQGCAEASGSAVTLPCPCRVPKAVVVFGGCLLPLPVVARRLSHCLGYPSRAGISSPRIFNLISTPRQIHRWKITPKPAALSCMSDHAAK